MCISIVIPISSEKYISNFFDCLDILMNQTLQYIEVICVDYGLSIEFKNILNKYSSQYKNMMLLRANDINDAFNQGIIKSTGEYVLFLNPNDCLYLISCERLYSQAKKEDLDILIMNYINYNVGTGEIFKNNNFNNVLNEFHNIIFDYKTLDKLLFEIPIYYYNVLYSKDFLLKNKIEFSQLDYSFYEFFFKAFLNAKNISFNKNNFYFKREFDYSYTGSITHLIKILNNILVLFKNKGIYQTYINLLINFKVGILRDYFENHLSNEVMLIIQNEFNRIKQNNVDYDENLKYLKTDNLLFFKNILNTSTIDEYSLLCENISLKQEIGQLKEQLNKLKKITDVD